MFIPTMCDNWLGDQAIIQLVENEREIVSAKDSQLQQVNKVFYRLLKSNNLEDTHKNFNFECHLVESDTVNAACCPGGKMIVYSGVFDLCDTEDKLSILLGHELSHALARHSMEAIQYKFLYFLPYILYQAVSALIFLLLFPIGRLKYYCFS
eukprot:UN02382